MGSIADICGIQKTATRRGQYSELVKAAYASGYNDFLRRYDFLKLAEELGEEEAPIADEAMADLALEDEGESTIGGEEAVDSELIEELIQAISDPTSLTDEEEDAILQASDSIEESEKEAGLRNPSVLDYYNMRMGQ